MKITNINNLPETFVNFVKRDYEYKDKRYSATSILKSVRQNLLTRRHDKEITQDVSDMMFLIFGTAIHKVLEESKGTDGQFKEERIEMQIEDYTLSGIIDMYDIDKKEVVDYKTCSVWKVINNDWEDYKQQLFIYATMLREKGFEVNKVKIVAMIKDHSLSKAKFDRNYPQTATKVIEFDFTEEDYRKTLIYIVSKFQEIKENENVKDEDLPLCSKEERWATDTKFALMKKGRKTAVKLFDNYEMANEVAKTDKAYFIEERKGEDKKCTSYCSCCKFCSYWKENYEEV